jgi:hypothetical protein
MVFSKWVEGATQDLRMARRVYSLRWKKDSVPAFVTRRDGAKHDNSSTGVVA